MSFKACAVGDSVCNLNAESQNRFLLFYLGSVSANSRCIALLCRLSHRLSRWNDSVDCLVFVRRQVASVSYFQKVSVGSCIDVMHMRVGCMWFVGDCFEIGVGGGGRNGRRKWR